MGLGATIYLHIALEKQPSSQAAFEATGHTARDVVNALVALDRLETAPSNPTSAIASRAISEAERDFGLPADGMADQTLLDSLTADLAAGTDEPAAGFTWTHNVYAGIEAIDILSGFVASIAGILGFLGFRSE